MAAAECNCNTIMLRVIVRCRTSIVFTARDLWCHPLLPTHVVSPPPPAPLGDGSGSGSTAAAAAECYCGTITLSCMAHRRPSTSERETCRGAMLASTAHSRAAAAAFDVSIGCHCRRVPLPLPNVATATRSRQQQKQQPAAATVTTGTPSAPAGSRRCSRPPAASAS